MKALIIHPQNYQQMKRNILHKVATLPMLLMSLSLFAISLLSSCKGGKGGFDPNKPTVTVTIEPFRYFVEQIAGDDVNINVMVPAGSNPETYEPTPQQMVDLANSVLYFKVGEIGFEKTWMKKLQQNAPKMKVIDTSAGIEMEKTRSGYDDPHTWMSITNAEIITANIAGALMDMFPDKAEQYKKKYWEFREHLDQLKDKLYDQYFAISGNRQTSFVIYHPILTYFAKEFKFEQYPIEDEGREPSISQIEKLINLAKSEEITVLFVQKEFANRNVQTFIDATGAKPIEINPLSYDWEGEMMHIMKCMTSTTRSEKASEKAFIRQSTTNNQQ